MSIIRKMTVALILLSLIGGLVLAAVSQAGNVVFQAPKDWKRVDQNNTIIFLAPDTPPKETCTIIMLPGQELQGDFRSWFESTLRGSLQSGERIVSGGEIKAERAQEGYDTLYTALVVEDKAGKRTYRFYLAAHPGARVEMILYAATSQELFNRYNPVLVEFVKNWNFVNAGAPSPNAGSSASASSSDGPVQQAGNLLFKIPKDWKRVDKGNYLLLVPPDAKPEQPFFIALTPGQDLQGDFRTWFDSTIRGSLNPGERVVEDGEVKAQRNPAGFDTLLKAMAVDDKSGQRSYRFYLAAHPGKRAELILWSGKNKEQFERYQHEIVDFIQGVSFANLSGQPTSPPARDPGKDGPSKPVYAASAGLDGLYVGTESRYQFNMLTHFYDYKVWQVYYLFLPDGRVYSGLSKTGSLDPFDFARAQREDPKNCGTYRISGDTIQFTWAGVPDKQPRAFQRGQNSVKIGGTWVHRATKEDGLRLDGTFGRQGFVNTSVAGTGTQGGVSSERRITFSRDGRFSMQGFSGFAGVRQGPYSGVATSTQTSGSGTYTIRGYTLELAYADGRREQHTFFRYPKEEQQMIVIDGTTYTRR